MDIPPPGTDNTLVMVAISTDGSGDPAGSTWYLNGAPQPEDYFENGLIPPGLTNDHHLRIGSSSANMELHFIEILDDAMNDAWFLDRWNGGSPLRGAAYIPEPATAALLGIGGLMMMVLRGRRSA